MQEAIKITLSPTQIMKKQFPHAIGTATILENHSSISINLFNFPEPNYFSRNNKKYTCYQAWLYNPSSGQVLPLGAFTDSGDQLYILYDIPIKWQEEFNEVIISAEIDSKSSPEEILMLGYLSNMKTEHLEIFQPFDPPLPDHKWWKIKKVPNSYAQQNTTQYQQCPNWQQKFPNHFQPYPYYQPMQNRRVNNNFGLPQILGLQTTNYDNVKYLVHGIPGRLLRIEQPAQGKTGYLYWQPYYGFEKEIGAIGYWLCYIDPKTNQIATPMGVCIPPG